MIFLLNLHQVPGSVEPLAYYVRRKTHIPGFLCPGISVLSQRFSHEIICVFQIHQTSS